MWMESGGEGMGCGREPGPWGFRLYARALSCKSSSPSPSLVWGIFFFNSLIVGEYVGIYQSE